MRSRKRLTGDLPKALHELCHETPAVPARIAWALTVFDDELVAPTAGATRDYFSVIGVFLIRCNIWLNGVSWLVITLSS